MLKRQCLVLLGVLAAPWAALAQDAGEVELNPVRIVREAQGGRTPVLEQSMRVRGAHPADTTLPLHTRRGECFEVVGFATGDSQVRLRVLQRGSSLGNEIALANSNGRPARVNFCAELSGNSYSVLVHPEGSARWALAVLPAERPAGLDAGVASGVDAGATAMVVRPSATYPVGGAERDYVGNRLRDFATQHPGVVGINPAQRVNLATNQVQETTLTLASGYCTETVAAGVPSVQDLSIEIEDPNGNRVAQDSGHGPTKNVRYCAPFLGTFRIRVRAVSGFGIVGIQTLMLP